MHKRILALLSLLLVLSMLLTACGSADTPPTEDVEAPVVEEPMEEEEPAMEEADVVEIRWYVGLGTGQQPEQVEAQEAVVEAFNASHDDIRLVLEIVNNEVATDTLSTELASGNPPDIVGPVGVAGSNAFDGHWLDLDPLIASTGYDLSEFDPATVDFYRVEGEGLLGLPFGVFPYFIYYNTSLFDEAGLEYPPHVYGEPYADGDAWDMAKLQELAMILTVDSNGNDATSADFDPDNIVQFGYHTQWTDPRGEATMFGAGSFVDADGNAVIPDHWQEAFRWYYDGIWVDHFIPNDSYVNSDLLMNGNSFGSGNVAMIGLHLWCHACYEGDDWDIAVVPSYEGSPTAKLHADTFRIMSETEHPEEAFEVLSFLLGEAAGDLLQVYGSMPARQSLQDAFFATLDETHTQGVDWQVAIDSLSYPDNPNHESNMPHFNQATDAIGAFQTLYHGTPDLDIDAEVANLLATLQEIFNAAE